jgi:hypothetical protein
LKEREVAAKEREVAAKEKEGKTSKWFNPVTIAIYVAAIGLFGNIFTNYSNNGASDKIERVRAQSSLVLSVIKTNGNDVDSCKNLDFFVRIGWLDDPKGAIHNVCGTKGEGGVPTLPATGDGSAGGRGGYGVGGYGQGGYGGGALFGSIALLTIKVEDADSHEPIENAAIEAKEPPPVLNGLLTLNTNTVHTTDSKGLASLNFVTSDETFTVSKDGYETVTKPMRDFGLLASASPSITIDLHRAPKSKHKH